MHFVITTRFTCKKRQEIDENCKTYSNNLKSHEKRLRDYFLIPSILLPGSPTTCGNLPMVNISSFPLRKKNNFKKLKNKKPYPRIFSIQLLKMFAFCLGYVSITTPDQSRIGQTLFPPSNSIIKNRFLPKQATSDWIDKYRLFYIH